MKIKINTIDDAKTLCAAANACDADVLLKHGRYVVDASSLLGIFSLSLNEPVDIEIVEHASGEAEKFTDLVKEIVL